MAYQVAVRLGTTSPRPGGVGGGQAAPWGQGVGIDPAPLPPLVTAHMHKPSPRHIYTIKHFHLENSSFIIETLNGDVSVESHTSLPVSPITNSLHYWGVFFFKTKLVLLCQC